MNGGFYFGILCFSFLFSFNKSFPQCPWYNLCRHIGDFSSFFSNLRQYFWGITSKCCILSTSIYFLDQFPSMKFPHINHSRVYVTDVRLHDKLSQMSLFKSFLTIIITICFDLQFSYSNFALINSSVPISWQRSMSNLIS